ncbi:MAG: glycosyltransferase family 4 protein [Parcubacteria group bacterium]
MKICLITEHFPPHIGGVEIAFEKYAEGLSAKDHEVVVITSNSGGITGEKNSGNLKIVFLDCKSFFGHPIIPVEKIEKYANWADVIHTTTFTAALPSLKAAEKFKKPCVLMVHEVLGNKWFTIEKNLIKALGFLFFERYVIKKKYSLWQAISQSTLNDLIKLGIPKEKIKLVYHGIDHSIWNPEVKKKNLADLLGFEKSDKIFLYNGRPGKTKGVFLLLEAIRKVKNALPKDFKFGFIISKNPKNERFTFENLIKKYNLQAIVKFTDSLLYPELPGYRKDAYAYIVPSLTEGFGFTAAEISALDVPLVVSDADSLPEVSSGKVLFFESGNSDDLAEKILLATKDKFETIRTKKFDWDDSINKIEIIYQELL